MSESTELVESKTKDLDIQAETESAKGVAAIQAAFVMAKKFPRDEHKAENRITEACTRYAFAEEAMYTYPRGKETVRGPSIRLAETMARYWGNLRMGFRELEKRKGSSLVQSYCLDLESNSEFTREFTVEHRIQLRGGAIKELTDPRDTYEIVANQAQRRVRACILQAIPAHIVEAAVAQVTKSLKAGTKSKPFADRVRDMVKSFGDLGVPTEMLEKRIGHKLEALSEDELVDFIGIYRSIKDGEQDRGTWFDLGTVSTSGKAEKLTQKIESKPEEKGTEISEGEKWEPK